MDMWMELEQEGVDPVLLKEVRAFHDANPPTRPLLGVFRSRDFCIMENRFGRLRPPRCCAVKIFCWRDPRRREKTCWQRIWPQHSEDLPGMYPSMSM